jgi:DNA relaxase NicK
MMAKKAIVKTNNKSEYELFLNEVQKKSYEIYEKRLQNDQNGDQLSDWLKAELELKSKFNIK